MLIFIRIFELDDISYVIPLRVAKVNRMDRRVLELIISISAIDMM